MKVTELKEQNMLCKSRWFVVFAFLFITGCGTLKTTQPVSDPLTAERDQSLYGHWLVKEKRREVHLFIGKPKTSSEDLPESIMEFVMTEWRSDDNTVGDTMSAYFTVSRIGKTSYINLFQFSADIDVQPSINGYKDWIKDPKKRVVILRYSVEGNNFLLLNAPSLDKIRKVKELKFIDNDTVTVDSLVRYLRKNGEDFPIDQPDFRFKKVP